MPLVICVLIRRLGSGSGSSRNITTHGCFVHQTASDVEQVEQVEQVENVE